MTCQVPQLQAQPYKGLLSCSYVARSQVFMRTMSGIDAFRPARTRNGARRARPATGAGGAGEIL